MTSLDAGGTDLQVCEADHIAISVTQAYPCHNFYKYLQFLSPQEATLSKLQAGHKLLYMMENSYL